MSRFVSIILQTFSSVASALSVDLFGGSSTPDITRHDLREYCFNLSTSIFDNLLVFVAIKLQDCASRSICTSLVTRLVNLSILLSWILMISRRSSTLGLEEEVMLVYGVVTGVSDSIAVGVDEVDFGVNGGVELFLVFILLLLLFPTILLFWYLSLAGCCWNSFNSRLKPPSYNVSMENIDIFYYNVQFTTVTRKLKFLSYFLSVCLSVCLSLLYV